MSAFQFGDSTDGAVWSPVSAQILGDAVMPVKYRTFKVVLRLMSANFLLSVMSIRSRAREARSDYAGIKGEIMLFTYLWTAVFQPRPFYGQNPFFGCG